MHLHTDMPVKAVLGPPPLQLLIHTDHCSRRPPHRRPRYMVGQRHRWQHLPPLGAHDHQRITVLGVHALIRNSLDIAVLVTKAYPVLVELLLASEPRLDAA